MAVGAFFRNLLPRRFRSKGVSIPVVRLQGVIATDGGPLRQSLNLAGVASSLEKAFSRKQSPAVAIVINSPGGAPVQSRLIFQRIRALAEEKEKQVLVFVEDVAASGGYMIALAGDEIFVDPTSIVGSIGVVSGGFGFPELLKKLGVERRVYTAGENKVILDPFQPEKEGDIEYLKTLQLDIHDVFIDMVKARRGSRLSDDPALFSGLFWTGRKGVELGLADGIGELREVVKRRFGKETKLELIGAKKSLFGRAIPGLAASAAGGIAVELRDRVAWGRYGL